MYDAIKEIKEINLIIEKLKTDYSAVAQRNIELMRKLYESKITEIKNQINRPKGIFESNIDYKNRVDKFNNKLSMINSELNSEINSIKKSTIDELNIQKNSLLNQRAKMENQVFPIGIADVSFKFGFYDAEKEQFGISFIVKLNKKIIHAFAFLPVTRDKAAQYYQNPVLLIPDVNLKLNKEAKFIPHKFSFLGPENEEYVCTNIVFGIKGTLKSVNGYLDRFLFFDNHTMYDRRTNLFWPYCIILMIRIGMKRKNIVMNIQAVVIQIGDYLKFMS